jgi:hypothetical protein
MNYVVAVSGGVDSMVLLDMIINNKIELSDKRTVIVAHFDHGIRADSAADARFVEGVARTHGLPFEMRREELGAATKGMPDNEILKAEGFYSVHVRSRAPLIRKRQLAVCALLEQGRIMYNPDKMPNMRKDFLLVEQDKVTLEKVKKNPLLTHASDGLDYGTDILFEDVGRKPQSQVFKLR